MSISAHPTHPVAERRKVAGRRANAVTTLLLGSLLAGPVMVVAETTEQRWPVENFSRLIIKSHAHVTLVQGDSEGVTASGDADDIGNLEVFVRANELVIQPRQRRWRDHGEINVVIELRQLAALNLRGSVTLQAEALHATSLDIDVAGGARIRVPELRAEALTVDVRGAADVELAGAVDAQTVEISGSADYDAAALDCRASTVQIKGSGNVRLAAADTLTVGISGSGNVRYRGRPQITQRINGSGSVAPI